MCAVEGKAAMWREEGREVSDRPAYEWCLHWQNLPSIVKAHKIYEKERLKASGVKPKNKSKRCHANP